MSSENYYQYTTEVSVKRWWCEDDDVDKVLLMAIMVWLWLEGNQSGDKAVCDDIREPARSSLMHTAWIKTDDALSSQESTSSAQYDTLAEM